MAKGDRLSRLSPCGLGMVMSNCSPVLPASWQPRHWLEVRKAVGGLRRAGADPGVVVRLRRHPGDRVPVGNGQCVSAQGRDHGVVKAIERMPETRIGALGENHLGVERGRIGRGVVKKSWLRKASGSPASPAMFFSEAKVRLLAAEAWQFMQYCAKPMFGRLLAASGGQSGVQPLFEPKPYQPQNQPSCEAPLCANHDRRTVDREELQRIDVGGTAQLGAGYISLTITAPSGIGGGLAGLAPRSAGWPGASRPSPASTRSSPACGSRIRDPARRRRRRSR